MSSDGARPRARRWPTMTTKAPRRNASMPSERRPARPIVSSESPWARRPRDDHGARPRATSPPPRRVVRPPSIAPAGGLRVPRPGRDAARRHVVHVGRAVRPRGGERGDAAGRSASMPPPHGIAAAGRGPEVRTRRRPRTDGAPELAPEGLDRRRADARARPGHGRSRPRFRRRAASSERRRRDTRDPGALGVEALPRGRRGDRPGPAHEGLPPWGDAQPSGDVGERGAGARVSRP